MTSLFLSYARGDDGESFDPTTSFVARLYRDLTAAGFDVWFDRMSMPAITRGLETVIEDAATAKVIARFPEVLENIRTHPSSRRWAGSAWNYLCLLTLEGQARPKNDVRTPPSRV